MFDNGKYNVHTLYGTYTVCTSIFCKNVVLQGLSGKVFDS